MKATTVDLVFVIDSSESMRPCFEALARNLDQVMQPLQGNNMKVRLGLVAMHLGRTADNRQLVNTRTLCGDESSIYNGDQDLFTTDPEKFSSILRSIELSGDENHLMAIDCALDFPFGPIATTRRVVALFSDEKIEDGMITPGDLDKIPAIITKIMDRKILFFAALPESSALEALGTVDAAEIETIDGGEGLASVNIGKLLSQMAKSISVSTMQGVERPFTKALFGQDKWVKDTGSFDGLR